MDKTEYAEEHEAVRTLLRHIGEDPSREGLLDTPKRVAKALREMTEGYGQSPADILSTTFAADGCDQMVVLRDIDFTSMCEHHMLPFIGKAVVAYIPKDRVIGLSKLARLVDCFARRLQIQERLTVQIADALEEHLEPLGIGVIVQAHHQCMSCRGIRKSGTIMITSDVRGIIRSEPSARFELMRFVE